MGKFDFGLSAAKLMSVERLVVVIACIAFVVDYMLYMAVVPIIPLYFREHNVYQAVNVTDPHSPDGWHIDYPEENMWNGYLFASKAFVHIAVCPFCGPLSDRIGYRMPLLFGLSVISASTVLFAIATDYWLLFAARSLQGLGSAFAETCSLAMIVRYFPDLNQRTTNIGMAFSCMQFGYLFGPWFGGTLFQYTSKFWPFILMAGLAMTDVWLVLGLIKATDGDAVREHVEVENPISIWKLFLDRRVMICSGALAVSEVAYTFMAPNVANWMTDSMDEVSESEIGFIWFAAFVPYLAGIRLSMWLVSHRPSETLTFTALGLLLAGASCIAIPLTAVNYFVVAFWFSLISLGIAIGHHCINLLLAELVDEYYSGVYGSVYAIAEISYNTTYALGPLIAGHIMEWTTFLVLDLVIAGIYFAYAAVMLIYRSDAQQIGNKATEKFKNEEDGEKIPPIEDIKAEAGKALNEDMKTGYGTAGESW